MANNKALDMANLELAMSENNKKLKAYVDANYMQAHQTNYMQPNIYSTEEQVVGTWIDGKPIYRIIGLCNIKAVKESWTSVADLSSLNIDTLIYEQISIDGVNNFSANYSIRVVPNRSCNTGYNPDTKQLGIYNGLTNYVYVTRYLVEYTKTTDTATIAIPSATALMDAYEEGVQEA